MTNYYKATFSNGRTITRATASRTYSHGWMIAIAWKNGGFRRDGFSGNEGLAQKALTGWAAYVRRNEVTSDFAEVAPAIEITAQEYRAILATRKAA